MGNKIVTLSQILALSLRHYVRSSEGSLLEHLTDGSDAFDTLYIGAEKFPYQPSLSLVTTGIL